MCRINILLLIILVYISKKINYILFYSKTIVLILYRYISFHFSLIYLWLKCTFFIYLTSKSLLTWYLSLIYW